MGSCAISMLEAGGGAANPGGGGGIRWWLAVPFLWDERLLVGSAERFIGSLFAGFALDDGNGLYERTAVNGSDVVVARANSFAFSLSVDGITCGVAVVPTAVAPDPVVVAPVADAIEPAAAVELPLEGATVAAIGVPAIAVAAIGVEAVGAVGASDCESGSALVVDVAAEAVEGSGSVVSACVAAASVVSAVASVAFTALD